MARRAMQAAGDRGPLPRDEAARRGGLANQRKRDERLDAVHDYGADLILLMSLRGIPAAFSKQQLRALRRD